MTAWARVMFSVLALLLVVGSARADDIDIYRGGLAAGQGARRVLLALDFRPGVNALVCRDAGAAGCPAKLGAELYARLRPPEPAGAELSSYATQRAALSLVLTDLAAAIGDADAGPRLEVALVLIHDGSCGDAAPPPTPPGPAPACSGGAELAQGFTDVGDPEQLAGLLAQLRAIPAPGAGAAPGGDDKPALAAYLQTVARRDECLPLQVVDALSGHAGVYTAGSYPAPAGAGRVTARKPRLALQLLRRNLAQLLGIRGTLVAAAFATNVYDRSRAPEDIFFPVFRTAPGTAWQGNLKKLKIARLDDPDPGSGEPEGRYIIAQAPLTRPPRSALDSASGEILPDALTFWTDPQGEDVLAADAQLGQVAGRDGPFVARGGAGQQVPGFLAGAVGQSNDDPGARRLFTRDPARPGALLPLDATAGTAAVLGSYLDPGGRMVDADRQALLGWTRGLDAFDEDGDGDRAEARAWLLGDLLHSRPLVINYGARPGTGYSRANPDIRLFFGTNDGIFHSLRNTADSGAGVESGREAWGFLPLELLSMQAALAGGQARSVAGKPYGMDGEAVALVEDRDGDGNIESELGDRVWVFSGQRRGGRGIYALDATDPDRPQLLWQITHRTPGFEQLGLTFSTPRVARVDLGDPAPTPVLVFAGGYNGGWQGGARIGKDAGAASDPVGNAVYVVAAGDGRLIWQALGPNGDDTAPVHSDQRYFVPALKHSIPAPLTVVDADNNGVADRAYVGDSGGNVWRITLGEYSQLQAGTAVTAPANWQMTRLAALGGSGAADRRFFHAADVTRTRDSEGDYLGVAIVSGNRADPLGSAVQNFAYLLKDRHGPGGEPGPRPGRALTPEDLADISGHCARRDGEVCSAAERVRGWSLALAEPGEKGLSAPLISNGVVFFTSFLPGGADPGAACTGAPGSTRAYAVKLGTGAAGLAVAGVILAPGEDGRHWDLGPGMLGDVVPYRDGVLMPGSGRQAQRLLGVPGRTRWRVYWRELGVDSP